MSIAADASSIEGGASNFVSSARIRNLPFKDVELTGRVNVTLDDIASGTSKFSKDGTFFRNLEGKLPARDLGYYKEYTVPTPGVINRGALRIVQGANNETYFTANHYGSFVRIQY